MACEARRHIRRVRASYRIGRHGPRRGRFRSAHRYDGLWDNYQCKHLKAPLGKAEFASELGKVFYYAGQGEFTLPSSYIFVCPNSAVRDVKKMIDRPSLIADFLIDNWDAYCLNGISTTPIPLTRALELAIRAYPFEKVELWKASELVEKPQMRAVLHEHLDIDPGEAPRVTVADVPADVADEESAYVTQLVAVFTAVSGTPFANYADVVSHVTYGPQMINARRRYLERQAFRRHFRDNLPASQIDNVDEDVHETVIDRYHALGTVPSTRGLRKSWRSPRPPRSLVPSEGITVSPPASNRAPAITLRTSGACRGREPARFAAAAVQHPTRSRGAGGADP